MAVVGVDVGTSGAKSTIVDEKGNLCGYSYSEYDLVKPYPGHYEINPSQIKNTVKKVIKESVEKYARKDIKAICVTSFGESFVLLDQNDQVLCNSMIYMDKRGSEECKEIEVTFTKGKTAYVTGLFPHAMYSAGKIMWLSKNKPNVLNKAKKLFFMADYILYTLGGGHFTDYSLASRSMTFDVVNKSWWEEMTKYIGIEKDILPQPVPTGSVVGNISDSVGKDLGLPSDVKLLIGGHDQITNAIGAGVLEDGSAINGIGTVDCITPAFSMRKINTLLAKNNFPCVPYIRQNMYATYAFNMTGGSLLKWFRDNFAKDLTVIATKKGSSVYSLLDSQAHPKPTSLLVLPHFAGTGTPYMDVSSKGAIVGLSFDIDRGQIYRALLEGETYEMNLNLQYLKESGINIKQLRTVGGGSKSDLWMQIRADIMNREIVCLNVQEAGTIGCAMLAGVATGIYQSLEEARDALVKVKKTYFPNPSSVDIYKENFERYKKVYKNVKEVIS